MMYVWCMPNTTVDPGGLEIVLFVMCGVCAVADEYGEL